MRTADRWWHWPAIFIFIAGLWGLFFASGHYVDWDSLALGAITGCLILGWAIEFTGNKTANTILKEWAEELSRRSNKR
jgi:hypothetical protein